MAFGTAGGRGLAPDVVRALAQAHARNVAPGVPFVLGRPDTQHLLTDTQQYRGGMNVAPPPVDSQGYGSRASNAVVPVDTQTGSGGSNVRAMSGPRGGRPRGQQAPSPFDPEYYQNVASYLFKTNAQIGADQQNLGYDRTALQSGLDQLHYQQPRDALSLEQRANADGSLYSSVYGQQQGNLAYNYLGREGGLASQSGQRMAALIQAIAALRGSIPLYRNTQALASAQRLSAAAGKNPALGEPKPFKTPFRMGG